MIVEVVRLLDRWLKSEPYGVEVMLRDIPRLTPEGTTDPMPEMPCIVNDTEDDSVAQELEPAKVPALVIYGTNGPTFPLNKSGTRATPSVRLAIAYITREAPWLQAVQDGGYVLRAAKRSLVHFNSLDKSKLYRRLNTITIAEIKTVDETLVKGAVGKSQLVGFLLATVVVIDSDL